MCVRLVRVVVRAREGLLAVLTPPGSRPDDAQRPGAGPRRPGPGGGLIEQHHRIQPKPEGDVIVDRGADHEVRASLAADPETTKATSPFRSRGIERSRRASVAA